jgi:hypothetical protein
MDGVIGDSRSYVGVNMQQGFAMQAALLLEARQDHLPL